MKRILFSVALVLVMLSPVRGHAEEGEDSSDGLPSKYSDYLIAANTLSPDKKIAVIYPTAHLYEDESAKDYLVQLQPFQILTALKTESPEFQNKNHGGMSASWSEDGTAVLVTLESKWGPGDVFLYELHEGKLTRSTELLQKVHDLLLPDYKKAMGARYNDTYDFIFETEDETPVCQFSGARQVQIRASATTDPKESPGTTAWEGAFEGTWDIAAGKFTAQKVKRKFAGVRKGD